MRSMSTPLPRQACESCHTDHERTESRRSSSKLLLLRDRDASRWPARILQPALHARCGQVLVLQPPSPHTVHTRPTRSGRQPRARKRVSRCARRARDEVTRSKGFSATARFTTHSRTSRGSISLECPDSDAARLRRGDEACCPRRPDESGTADLVPKTKRWTQPA